MTAAGTRVGGNPMTTTRCQFNVRKTASGYTGIAKFLVFNGSKRVTVHAFGTKEAAQASADDLNINAMVKDFDEDPRPYSVRLAEATAAYTKLKADAAATCPGCGRSFDGLRGLRSHQSQRFVTSACKVQK